MSEMVDRVARAIWNARYPPGTPTVLATFCGAESWDQLVECAVADDMAGAIVAGVIAEARAAIAAMRAPTRAMMVSMTGPYDDRYLWERAIDTALDD